jgi:hypothetical protein
MCFKSTFFKLKKHKLSGFLSRAWGMGDGIFMFEKAKLMWFKVLVFWVEWQTLSMEMGKSGFWGFLNSQHTVLCTIRGPPEFPNIGGWTAGVQSKHVCSEIPDISTYADASDTVCMHAMS